MSERKKYTGKLAFLNQYPPEVVNELMQIEDFAKLDNNDQPPKQPSPKKASVKITSVHKDHRKRVRDKFLKYGLESFSEFEVLEYILFYSIPYKDTNELAHDLIEKFGSLQGVMNADELDLTSVKGISDVSASLIVLFREVYKYMAANDPYTNHILSTSTIAGEFCCNYFKSHVEESFIVITIDGEKRIKCVDVISNGEETETPFFIRRVIRCVVKNRATAVILAHNHPDSNENPSVNDVKSTETLSNVLSSMGITVLDHIVCSKNKFVSLSDKGYLFN